MKTKLGVLISILISFSLLQITCTIPRLIWSQKDIPSYTINQPSQAHKILIASHHSEFKDKIIDKIKDSLKTQSVYLKFTGTKQLNQEDINKYDAVLIMTSCIAWGINGNIKSFLKQNKKNNKIILLTTSGDGNWTPDIEGNKYDAISSASEMQSVDKLADIILSSIQERFN